MALHPMGAGGHRCIGSMSDFLAILDLLSNTAWSYYLLKHPKLHSNYSAGRQCLQDPWILLGSCTGSGQSSPFLAQFQLQLGSCLIRFRVGVIFLPGSHKGCMGAARCGALATLVAMGTLGAIWVGATRCQWPTKCGTSNQFDIFRHGQIAIFLPKKWG